MYNSFKIVEKNHKIFFLTKGNILFGIMLILAVTNNYLDENISLVRYLFGLSILTVGIYFLTENIRYEKFRGKYNGILKFSKNNLKINEREIELNQIKKIFLRTDDYKGVKGYHPAIRMSNGTNNLLDLELTNGEKIKLFFQIEYENQVEELRPFIISLIKNELLTIEKGIEILKLDNDYILDNFIEELNKKELD